VIAGIRTDPEHDAWKAGVMSGAIQLENRHRSVQGSLRQIGGQRGAAKADGRSGGVTVSAAFTMH